MNLLQSFMGCMYPGSIRTDSIESINYDLAESHRFPVANIDEQGNEVSNGELQLTDQDLIYFRHKRFPTRWPLGSIRRYGSSKQGSLFIFESGRRCQTGQAIFAFRLSRGQELLDMLKEKIEKCSDTNNHQDNNTNQAIPEPTQDLPTLRPLSYALIDFDLTKALNESAQDHAASRAK